MSLKGSIQLGGDKIVDQSQGIIHLSGILAAAHSAVGLAAAAAAAGSADQLHKVAGLDALCKGILAANSQEGDLIAIHRGQHSNNCGLLVTEQVAHLTQLASISIGDGSSDNMQTADLAGAEQEALGLTCSFTSLEGLNSLLQVLDRFKALISST